MPEHQHVNDHGERLDGELRHREIGCAVQQECHGDAVADDAKRQHGRHGGFGQGCGDGTRNDHRDDQDFMGPNIGSRRKAKGR